MTYETYLNSLEQALACRLLAGETLKRVQVLKNNGLRLDGFSYGEGRRREKPTVYVNQYYREDLTDQELSGIAGTVLKIQRESGILSAGELPGLLDYDGMKERIYCRLISREKNQELLEAVPYAPFLDLALVFYLRIPEHIVRGATALIHRSHMEYWGVGEEELFNQAMENMGRESFTLESMEELLEYGEPGTLAGGMYVLSNSWKEFGAAVIAGPKVQEECARRLGGDYYILPSSIHELILLPADPALERAELQELVEEVNRLCVSREDYLSDRVYRYHSGSGQIRF